MQNIELTLKETLIVCTKWRNFAKSGHTACKERLVACFIFAIDLGFYGSRGYAEMTARLDIPSYLFAI